MSVGLFFFEQRSPVKRPCHHCLVKIPSAKSKRLLSEDFPAPESLKILKSIKTKQDCIEHTIDVYSSTLTEIEWLKEDFEHEFKAYESIHADMYQSMMNQIEKLKQTVEKELTVAENMKANTKEEKQKVLILNKK